MRQMSQIGNHAEFGARDQFRRALDQILSLVGEQHEHTYRTKHDLGVVTAACVVLFEYVQKFGVKSYQKKR